MKLFKKFIPTFLTFAVAGSSLNFYKFNKAHNDWHFPVWTDLKYNRNFWQPEMALCCGQSESKRTENRRQT